MPRKKDTSPPGHIQIPAELIPEVIASLQASGHIPRNEPEGQQAQPVQTPIQSPPPAEPAGSQSPEAQTQPAEALLNRTTQQSLDEIKKNFIVDRDRSIYNTFMNTIAEQKDLDMAQDVVDYILRHLNKEGLLGTFEYNQYSVAQLDSVKGVFKLIYLKHYPDENASTRLVERDTMNTSAREFIAMLMTRVFEGKDYRFAIAELESRRPIMVQGQQPR